MSIFCPEIEPFALIDVIFAPQISRGSTADANKRNFWEKTETESPATTNKGTSATQTVEQIAWRRPHPLQDENA